MVRYGYVIVTTTDLDETIYSINKYQDKIIAVTQHENYYTVFYENAGNDKQEGKYEAD